MNSSVYGQEGKLCKKVMAEDEMDSEDGYSVLVRRTLLWHSKMLTKLMRTLDSGRIAKSYIVLKKNERRILSLKEAH